jgi:serine/threonine-protein kinase HipA
MRKVNVRLRWSPQDILDVGQLAEADRRVYFEYDSAFLGRRLNLSPFKLPVRAGLIEHTDRAYGPLPGLIEDSLPDGWGRLLMDRMFRQRGVEPASVSSLDRLSYLGTRAMGALTFHPPADETERDERLLDLHELGENAQAVLEGETATILPQLMRAGGSPAGARPKVLVGIQGDQSDRIVSGEDDLPDGYEHWIVKFSSRQDSGDAGPIEYAYAALARAAGIDFPTTRLFHVGKGESYFGVRRFDRQSGNRRLHVHTFANLIHANFRIPSTDYVDLLKVTLVLTRNHADVLRAFRQMVFNIVTHNRDDHAKNFAFIMNALGEWTLSPAYDLTHSFGPGGEHTLSVAGEGRSPVREHVLKVAERSEVSRNAAIAIMDEVNAAVGKWDRLAEDAGVTGKRSREIAQTFTCL